MMLKALKALPPSNYSEAAVSQLKLYADEYRRGAFAVNAPNRNVEIVGGRMPEGFESIVRRHAAQRPDLAPGFGRKLKAIGGFLKILATRAPNVEAIEAKKDFVVLEAPNFSQDDPDWRDTHLKTTRLSLAGKAA